MKKAISFALTLALGLSLLAGCGSGGKDNSSGSTPNNDSSVSTPNGSTGPKEIRVALESDIAALDPRNANSTMTASVMSHIFSKLVSTDAKMNAVPDLAESWEQVDELTWRFHLRKDVTFHDGSPFTSADVVYTLDSIAADNTWRLYTDFSFMKASAVDEYTVDIKLKAPYPNAMRVLAGGRGGIVCKSAIEEMGEDAYGRAPVGSGAFIVTNWSSGDRIELTRNDNYWGEKPVYKDLTFRIITENASRTIEIETGGVDIAFDIGSDDVERLEADSNVNVVRGASSTMNHIVINSVNFDTLKNPQVRQAMHMALDMDAIVAVAFKGYATVAESLSPSSTTEIAKVGPTAYDPEGAKELIAQSGFDTSTPIILQIYKNQQIQAMAEIIANMWSAIGLTVQIVVVDRASMVSNNSSG